LFEIEKEENGGSCRVGISRELTPKTGETVTGVSKTRAQDTTDGGFFSCSRYFFFSVRNLQGLAW
jgi:hypothetical protein